MKIKTISGHLTATNKQHIKAMFAAERMSAKVNRINYKIERLSKPNEYEVKSAHVDLSIVIGEKIRVDKATFRVI